MQKQKPQGKDAPDFALLEECGGTRRDFLKASIAAGTAALFGFRASTAKSTSDGGQTQPQSVFNGVFELGGGGELLLDALPNGILRGSRDGGRTQMEGRAKDGILSYRWWSSAGGGDYRDAQPNARGSGKAVFKSPTGIAGEEKTEDGSAARSWSAKSKPENNGILTVNKPFTGAWTNGRGDFLVFSQHYDGGLIGVHTPARGRAARLRGFARRGILEYVWWAPRKPGDPYDRTPLTMRGSGIMNVTAEGRLQNEWATERDKEVKRVEFLERVKPASQEPQAKHTVIPDLNDATFMPFVRKNPLAVVDFWAPWCGPCKMIAPFFERLAAQRPDVASGRLNVDVGRNTKRALNVGGIPQIIFFRNGTEVHRVVGANPDELARAFNAFR